MILKILCVLTLAAATQAEDNRPRTARDYFLELREAKQLNRYMDTFVCFADDDVPSFAVMSRGSDIIDHMKRAGLMPDKTVLEAKNSLFVETYYKGVRTTTEVFSPVGEFGTDWDREFNMQDAQNAQWRIRMLYSINWATGRYSLSVYVLDRSATIPATQRYGKCELIHIGQ